MGKRRTTLLDHHHHRDPKSHTLPPSPSHSFSSSSSSDFEFTISVSPRKSSSALCPADELFYKGQLLPLHLSPRLSMVRTLLLASSSTSSSSDASTTTASRDSTGSSNDSQYSSFNSELVLLAESCDSSRRASSVTEDEELKRLTTSQSQINLSSQIKNNNHNSNNKTTNKYFSLARFSSVFKKEPKQHRGGGGEPDNVSGSSVKRMSATAKEVIRKYLKKVKPLYEKISQKQQQQQQLQKLGRLMTVPPATTTTNAISFSTKLEKSARGADQFSTKNARKDGNNGVFSHSFSGNLRYPRRTSCISSCPSSIRSSPSHSGVLCRPGFGGGKGFNTGGGMYNYADTSSMEELQSAIQGAIAHCKNSLVQHSKSSSTMVSNEI